MSVAPYLGGRRRLPGQSLPLGFLGTRGLGGLDGLGPSSLAGRGLELFPRLNSGGLLRGVSPLMARRGILSGADFPAALSEALLRGVRSPDAGRRALDELLSSASIGHYPDRDVDALLSLGRLGGRGPLHGRDCGSCAHNCRQCSGGGERSESKDVKTKDVIIRGKTYKIRKTFLAEAGKFESEIVKLSEKKSKESLPDNVIEMLVDFINDESCKATKLIDVVSMCILASNLNVKSAVEYALELLKENEVDYVNSYSEMTQICLAVLQSGKVDEKLVEWLKRFLKYDERAFRLLHSPPYLQVLYRKPELDRQIGQLLGLVEKDDHEEEFRIL